MKILYVANERSDAQGAATALHGIAANVRVLWASHSDQAANWIHENRDLSALVVEAQVDSQRFTTFLKQVQGLGLKAPLVVIGPAEAAPRLASLELGPFDFVAKDPSLFRILPGVVARAIARSQTEDDARRDRGDTRQPQQPGSEPRHAHEHRSRQETRPPLDQSVAVQRAAAAERQTALEGLVEQARATSDELRQKLGRAEAALQDAERRHQSALSAASAQLAETRAQYEIGMARAAAAWEMVDEQLRAAAIEVERARRSQAAAGADVDRLRQREAELASKLADATAARQTLERQLAGTEAAFADASDRATRERFEAARTAAGREAELDGLLGQERATRTSLEQQLAAAEAALRDAKEQGSAALTKATAELAERRRQFEIESAESAIAREDLARRLADAEAALQEAREHHASAAGAVERLTQREAALASQLADAVATRSTLEHQLAGTEAAFKDADERATRERLAAARRAADREAELDGLLDHERTMRAGIEQRLTQREAELAAQLADAAVARETLERQLADAATAIEAADERAARERVEAARRGAEREAELDGLLGHERAARTGLEQQLAEVEAALREAEQRHASAAAEAAAELAERERQFESGLIETAAAREELERHMAEARAALEEARQQHASAAGEVERLAQREAELAAQLANAGAARETLELQLADAATALKDAHEGASRDSAAAAEREAGIEARLAEELTRRDTLERELAETRAAAADAGQRFREETAAMTARACEQAARFEDLIGRERLDQEIRLADVQERLRNLSLERDALGDTLASLQAESQRVDAAHREEREALERARLQAEAEVQRLTAEHAQGQHALEEARQQFQATLDRVASEHASALAAVAVSVTERDARLEEQAARRSALLQQASTERAQLKESFRTTLAARNRDIERLQRTLEATTQELHATKHRRDTLRAEAERVRLLQGQLDETRAEMRRQFDHVPLALCRCTRGGTVIQANQAFAELLGDRSADDLHNADLAAAAFESPADLSWLIERCLSTNAKESVETTWRGRQGSRLFVRLSAHASPSAEIDIVAEDLTNLRALQDRLGQAHRMEAVGRLASEVAATCDNLLREVRQDAEQWLTAVAGDTAARRQGEMLLDEVTRAAGFLRQLAAYSDEEASALASVDLNTVLHDLEPVLKHVAGDTVEIELPRSSAPVTVDIKAERVERLLVNLASYGRERMPSGGRLRIELAKIVVDRGFIDKYPNVRQGPHALITVTGVRRTHRAKGLLRLADGPEPGAGGAASERPGVDLGSLQALIRDCGGHLWMTVEPLGDMVAKIHLPLSVSDDRTLPRPAAVRSPIARWFQH